MYFTERFENKVKNCIEQYKLLNKNEKVIVACSGGKDSTTVLYLLNRFGYRVEGLIIDLLIGNWSKDNLSNIRNFCETNGIKLNIVSIRDELGISMCHIRSLIKDKKRLNNCSICGVIKRWLLNKKAKELKAKKIATGHNLDDEAENILMNIFKGNLKLSLNLGPKTGVLKDKKFVQRVKPLYFCSNEEVKRYSKLMKFPVLYEACPCSMDSFRRDVRKFIDKFGFNVRKDIVENFLKELPLLRKSFKTKVKLKYCEICGEPSRNDICKFCRLFSLV